MKTCFKCGIKKSLTEFYAHPRMKDGHLNKCKECNKRDVIENRDKKLDYYRSYDLERSKTPERIKLGLLSSKRRTIKYPEKRSAHAKARQAFLSGKITKKDCEHCGNVKTEMHHNDYSKPLDVMWLCKLCHESWHRKNGDFK